MVNKYHGSFLVSTQYNFVVCVQFPIIVQNCFQVISFLNAVFVSVLLITDMRYLLVNVVSIITSPKFIIILINVILIEFAFILVVLSNLQDNITFLYVIFIIWIHKHVLIVVCDIEILCYFFVFVWFDVKHDLFLLDHKQ